MSGSSDYGKLGDFLYYRSGNGWHFNHPTTQNGRIFLSNDLLNNVELLKEMLSKSELAITLFNLLNPLPEQFSMSPEEINIRQAVSDIEDELEEISAVGKPGWFVYNRFAAIEEIAREVNESRKPK